MKTINPTTEESISEYERMTETELDSIVREANKAQDSWHRRSFAERAECLRNAADILTKRKQEFAELMANEMGKPLPQGESESEKCAWVCNYYADNAEDFLADEPIASDAEKSYLKYNPLGTVLAIMPWNFPFWQLFRFAAPALMAGNAAILKHAPNVTGCAMAIEEVMHAAGIPKICFARWWLMSIKPRS
ncbi:MAG: aldehyde dehydrogenase family protein [Fodinibius sp.]|nr:aldehyde dehydrogenase family protein [Fodinibius sp.]